MNNTLKTTFDTIKDQIMSFNKDNLFSKMRIFEDGKSIEDFKVGNFRITTNKDCTVLEIRKSSKRSTANVTIDIEGMNYEWSLNEKKKETILEINFTGVKVMYLDGTHRYDSKVKNLDKESEIESN